MKILILGSEGQLGSDLNRLLLEKAPDLELFSWTHRELDLLQSGEIIPALLRADFDLLVNCASYNRVDDAEENSREAYAINTHAVEKIAEACHQKGARLIHVSTDYVFDGKKGAPYLESDSPAPLNIYGASKQAGEMMALTRNDNTLILRTASLYGVAGSRGKGGNFVETILGICKEKGSARVVNDITMSPTSSKDLACMLLNLFKKSPPAGIYNAVNAGSATWYDFAREIVSLSQVRAEIIPVTSREFPRKATRPAFSVLDHSKITRVIGSPRNWREALDEYLREKGHKS